MPHKVILDDLVSLTNSTSATNQNSRRVEAAIENTLSRDGSLPNAMLADLDMNSRHIVNLPVPASPTEPVRLGDLLDEIPAVAGAIAFCRQCPRCDSRDIY
jgi:hypothetical protein